jgi:dienelactone hydrolase
MRNGGPATLAKFAAVAVALLIADALASSPVKSESPVVVEFENPLASPQPLQGYLRRTNGADPSPAVVLLHSCNGNWQRLDQGWGMRIASWGYVTLTVDSFGPRGIKNTCGGGAPVDMAFDAYRALNFLEQQPFVDSARVVVLGFSQGGALALSSVEHGIVEQISPNKFRAAIAFYPPCLGLKSNMTVPTLILIGERDDWTLASECRNMADGRDDWGISRRKGEGIPVRLVVYPDAFHAFDASSLQTPIEYLGHHLEFNQAATDQSIDAVREFLDATIGAKEQAK